MRVYRRNTSKIWSYAFEVSGVQYRRSAKTTDRAIAEKRAHEHREEVWRQMQGGVPSKTLSEAMVRYNEEYLPTLKPNSQRRYIASQRCVVRHEGLHPLLLKDVNKARLSEYIAARKREGVHTATIRRDLAFLSSVYERCNDWGWFEGNPIRTYNKRSLREADQRTRFLRHDEYEKLLSACPAWLAELIIFAVETGLRFNEQMTLTWRQVDLSKKEITLLETKSGKPRVVPLSDAAAAQIQAQPRRLSSALVFSQRSGQPYKRLTRPLATAAQKAGIQDLRWHDLRHTFASWAIQNGMGIYTLSRLLGHATVQITQRYAHLQTDDLRAAVESAAQKRAQGTRILEMPASLNR